VKQLSNDCIFQIDMIDVYIFFDNVNFLQ